MAKRTEAAIAARWAAVTGTSWTVEPHGPTTALYTGRDRNHHGLRLLNLDDPDSNGPANIAAIANAPQDIAYLFGELGKARGACQGCGGPVDPAAMCDTCDGAYLEGVAKTRVDTWEVELDCARAASATALACVAQERERVAEQAAEIDALKVRLEAMTADRNRAVQALINPPAVAVSPTGRGAWRAPCGCAAPGDGPQTCEWATWCSYRPADDPVNAETYAGNWEHPDFASNGGCSCDCHAEDHEASSCEDCPIGGRDGSGPVCTRAPFCDRECGEHSAAYSKERGPVPPDPTPAQVAEVLRSARTQSAERWLFQHPFPEVFASAPESPTSRRYVWDYIQRRMMGHALVMSTAPAPAPAPAPVCNCGQPLTRNPHPDAGKPRTLLTVGAMWVCVPCLSRTRHEWAERATSAEAALDQIKAKIEAMGSPGD